jgi:hypothetical protein
MDFPPNSTERLLTITLALTQYPILAPRIRACMRRELFERQIINRKDFEAQVTEEAIQTQRLEGMDKPLLQESSELWSIRLAAIREHMTDLIFSEHLSFEVLEDLISSVLSERGVNSDDLKLAINPELAPLDLVFEQALTIESLPPGEREKMEARYEESKVVLIRNMISDQLRYVNIAKEWFTIPDLAEIRRRKIGSGKIGGKAAGMLLAQHILKNDRSLTFVDHLRTPESYFIGSDELYNFMAINNLFLWNDQKYKSEDEMRAEYPEIERQFVSGSFSPDILDNLQTMLIKIGRKPLIVRSSSLLEDSFGTSFAGKYESIFCPNQGNLDENLRQLTQSIARIYCSTLNPNALLYRRSRGLLDYDERMAILIQVVEGEKFQHFFMPHAAGVAFSRNLYRWAPQIRAEDGFVRLVWGLGTRAVDRVGNDYPRLIALSHPLLRPSTDAREVVRYSQQFVDLIDLDENAFRTLPVHEVLDADYPPLRYLAQVDEDGYFVSLRSAILGQEQNKLVLTFDEMLSRTPFAEWMRSTLKVLETTYHAPVDVEFTAQINSDRSGGVNLSLTILQCRPQSQLQQTESESLPSTLSKEDIIFSTEFMVPQGHLDQIHYVVYVDSRGYFSLPTQADRTSLARTIGKLNAAMANEQFICIGPGRWGSANSDLGVPIAYGDIYHTRALVELAGEGYGLPPEPSLGTHFFQDLLESQIYPLAIQLDDSRSQFNNEFFTESPNRLLEWLPDAGSLTGTLKVIRVEDYAPRSHLKVVMNDEIGKAVAFLVRD